MGNLISEHPVLYLHHISPSNEICKPCDDLATLPSPLHGKVVIPFTLAHQKREFITRHHHQVLLLNDQPLLESYFKRQFKGVPVITHQQLTNRPEECIQMSFDQKYCPVPLILERFNEVLLKNYLIAFSHRGIRVEYFDRLQHFLKSQCTNNLLVCSSVELEQLSHRIQNLTYNRRENQKKMTIMCFCNRDQYLFSKRTEVAMQANNIDVTLHQNMLQIIQKIRNDLLTSHAIALPAQKVLFYLDQKQKEMNYLLKMAKRIERTVKQAKVGKVLNKQKLLDKIQGNQHSIVILSSDAKQMRAHLDFYESLETIGIQDRALFLRRDNQMGSNVMQKIQTTIVRPKYRSCDLTEKPLVFFGTLDSFKKVLSSFPQLTFKKFVDSTKDKHQIIHFLRARTQIVVSTQRICECMEEWGFLECRIILLQSRRGTFKGGQQQELIQKGSCPKEVWFSSEQELLRSFSNDESILNLDCNYGRKKMATIGKILNQTFMKLKEKKTLLHNQLTGSVFLFSCEYYFLDQVSSIIIKYFTSKILGSFEKKCLFHHLRFKLYDELLMLHRTSVIEEEVLQALERDQSKDIFELSDNLLGLTTQYPFLLEEINSAWELFLYQDRAEYLSNCQIILFLMLLSFNKTSFTQHHNETLQHLTLKVKSGTISCQEQSLVNFAAKTKNSFVYNMGFLHCFQYQPGQQVLEEGDIIIKLEGNELNNFGFSLPVWRRGTQVLIAPLTKFQFIYKHHSLNLKLSFNGQQKMLEKFNEHFLEQKVGLRLFAQERVVRSLDAFLESMSRGKLEAAGVILKKFIREDEFMNKDLLNAYIILHHLKCGDIEQAYKRLRQGKYFDILSKVITSCREGSSVEAAHSQFTTEIYADDKQSFTNTSNHEIDHVIPDNLLRSSTFDARPKDKSHRRSSGNYSRRFDDHRRSRRSPVPIRPHQKRRHAETSMIMTKKDVEEQEPKIKIFSPTNNSISIESDNSPEGKKITANFNSNFLIQQNTKKQITVKEAFQCSLSRLNSQGSQKSFATDFFQFQDPVNESLDEGTSLDKRKLKKKNSRFFEEELEKQKSHTDTDQLEGSVSGTGNFNFHLPPTSHEEQYVDEQLEEDEGTMIPVVEEEEQKISDSEEEGLSTGTGSDYFKFSLGVNNNGQKIFGIRNSTKLPRNSIETKGLMNQLSHLPKLVGIEQESCSYIPSNQNLSRSNILQSSTSDKQNQNSSQNLRNQSQKLFTFFKNNEVKHKFSGARLPSSSLMLSQDSCVQRVDEKQKTQNKSSLFMIFGEEQKSELSEDENSRVSIDFDLTETPPPNQADTNEIK